MQLLHRNRSLAVHRARHPIGGVVRGFNSINKLSTTTLHRLTTNDKYFLIPSLVASVGQLAILKKQPLSPVARPGVMAYNTERWIFFLSLSTCLLFFTVMQVFDILIREVTPHSHTNIVSLLYNSADYLGIACCCQLFVRAFPWDFCKLSLLLLL